MLAAFVSAAVVLISAMTLGASPDASASNWTWRGQPGSVAPSGPVLVAYDTSFSFGTLSIKMWTFGTDGLTVGASPTSTPKRQVVRVVHELQRLDGGTWRTIEHSLAESVLVRPGGTRATGSWSSSTATQPAPGQEHRVITHLSWFDLGTNAWLAEGTFSQSQASESACLMVSFPCRTTVNGVNF